MGCGGGDGGGGVGEVETANPDFGVSSTVGVSLVRVDRRRCGPTRGLYGKKILKIPSVSIVRSLVQPLVADCCVWSGPLSHSFRLSALDTRKSYQDGRGSLQHQEIHPGT